jgi:uncharacterized membrane protein YeaQ/YmgE (transglycosylase-associated protein family)
MGLLTWIFVGLVAGLAGELILGGGLGGGLRGLVITVLLGIGGAIVGGLISGALGYGDVTGFNVRSLVIATAGAILVILVWRKLASPGGRTRFS